MSNELTVFLESSGLVEAKRNDIAITLGAFFERAKEWNQTIASIIITDPSETGKMKMAKEGRLTLKNMRLEAEKVVKAKRETVKTRMADDILEDKLLLKAGQMVEATFKNLEGKLQEKEEFAERWEAENKAKLKVLRDAEVFPYSEFLLGFDLGNLSEIEYQKFFAGLKLQMQSKIEKEAKEKAEQEAKMKAEAEEREKIKIENERLKVEAIAIKKKAEEEAKILKAENDAKLKAERDLAESKAKQAKKIADEAKAKVDAENFTLKAEQLKRDNEAKEAKAKVDAENAEQEKKKKALEADFPSFDRTSLIQVGVELKRLETCFYAKTEIGIEIQNELNLSIKNALNQLKIRLNELK